MRGKTKQDEALKALLIGIKDEEKELQEQQSKIDDRLDELGAKKASLMRLFS
jgi:hypothetical protein